MTKKSGINGSAKSEPLPIRAAIPPPSPEDVPHWSEETLEAFRGLTPLERSFVEHYSTGSNSAEAYRKAKGIGVVLDRLVDTARNNGYAIRSRPHVARAIEAAMKDLNFDARMNRHWMLQRLQVALEKAEASDKPADQETVALIIAEIAKLKGEYLPERMEHNVTHDITPAAKRFFAALELARQKAGVVVVQPEETQEAILG